VCVCVIHASSKNYKIYHYSLTYYQSECIFILESPLFYLICVLYSQNKSAIISSGEQIVVKSRSQATKMDLSCRTGGKSDTDFFSRMMTQTAALIHSCTLKKPQSPNHRVRFWESPTNLCKYSAKHMLTFYFLKA